MLCHVKFFAVSVKTWLDVWSVELEELPFVREKSEWKSDVKYLKLQTIVDLCRNYGVYTIFFSCNFYAQRVSRQDDF